MNALIALTLTGSLAASGAATPAQPSERKVSLAAQVEALKEYRPSPPEVTATAAARRERDSLKNGAIIGGAIAGAAMGGFVYVLCQAMDDTGGGANCAGPAAIWGGIAAAGGAAVGAGVDALFDQKTLPGRVSQGRGFKAGFRF